MTSLQDFADTQVPEGQGPRYKWLYLTNVENGVTVCVPVFMFGATLGMSLSMGGLLTALALAGLCLMVLSGWSSYIGVKTRLSTALLVRQSFGLVGARVVWALLALSLFGWFGVQTELFAKAFMMMLAQLAPDTAVSPVLVTLASGALMSVTAVMGIKGVGKLAQIAMPVLLGTMLYALYEVLAAKGLTPWLSFQPEKAMSIGVAVAAIIGGYAVGAIVMPDIKRFALNVRHSVWSAFLALGLFYPLLLLLTALCAVLMQQPDFMALLVSLGMGSFVLVILMLAAWTTNDMNLYSASLNLAVIFPKVPRAGLTALSGAIGTLIAVFGVFEHLIPLFALIGVLTTPLLAIYSVDYLGGAFARKELRTKTNVAALSAWGAASLFGFMTTPADQYGLGLLSFTTVSGLDSLLMAFLLYVGVFLVRKRCSGGLKAEEGGAS